MKHHTSGVTIHLAIRKACGEARRRKFQPFLRSPAQWGTPCSYIIPPNALEKSKHTCFLVHPFASSASPATGRACPDVTSLISLLVALRNSIPIPTATLKLTLSPHLRRPFSTACDCSWCGWPGCVGVDRVQAPVFTAHPGRAQLSMVIEDG